MAKKDVPEKLKPYESHRLDFSLSGKEAKCDCPFCGGENKFTVNTENGLSRCFTCTYGTAKGGGNCYTFLSKLLEISQSGTDVGDYKELAEDRRLLQADTLIHWGIAKSAICDDWLVPAYNQEGKLNQVYRYANLYDPKKTEWKRKLLATSGLSHGIFGAHLWDDTKPEVWIFEGPWDAMAVWELCRMCKDFQGKLIETANAQYSLYSQANIIAVPGVATFYEKWFQLLAAKDVTFFYDNDYPREHPKTGERIPPASWSNLERIVSVMTQSVDAPNSVSILRWNSEGDHDTQLPDGYDVRDFLTESEDA